MSSINESLFNRVVSYLNFSYLFCYCAYLNILHTPEWKFLEGRRLVTLDCSKSFGVKKIETTALKIHVLRFVDKMVMETE